MLQLIMQAEIKIVLKRTENLLFKQVFCAAWSPDGKYLCTVCKDGKVRIFNPRKSPNPVMVRK